MPGTHIRTSSVIEAVRVVERVATEKLEWARANGDDLAAAEASGMLEAVRILRAHLDLDGSVDS